MKLSKTILPRHPGHLTLTLLILLLAPFSRAQDQEWTVGMSANGSLIQASKLETNSPTAPSLLLIGGLDDNSRSTRSVQREYERFSSLPKKSRQVNLLVIPNANPDGEALMFPPSGQAYQDNPTAFSLWRWIASHAPDLVVIDSEEDHGLAAALNEQPVAGVGMVPARLLSEERSILVNRLSNPAGISRSPARRELIERQQRSPRQFAEALVSVYGQEFTEPSLAGMMVLTGRLRLGQTEAVGELLQPHLSAPDLSLESSHALAGYWVFAKYAELTGNREYLALAQTAAEASLNAGLLHEEVSDALLMAPLLSKVGKLTGETLYVDHALRHVDTLQSQLLRPDGLYQHTVQNEIAWGRGNGYPALGLALVLNDLTREHPAFESLQQHFQAHIDALMPHQDSDGMWRQVIDVPGSYPEITATAMVATAILRGIHEGWLERRRYQSAVDRAWEAVLTRSSRTGEFINVSEKTQRLDSLQDYLQLEARLARDPLAGGAVLMLAAEMLGPQG